MSAERLGGRVLGLAATEGLGLVLLVPMLATLTDRSGSSSALARMFERAGFPVQLEPLLALFVALVSLRAASALARIGYPGPSQGAPFEVALRAFQRRYRPDRCDGRLDDESMGLVMAVADLYDAPETAT